MASKNHDKPKCQYEGLCFRQSKAHLEAFIHPDPCRYASKCTDTSDAHRRRFAHPRAASGAAAAGAGSRKRAGSNDNQADGPTSSSPARAAKRTQTVLVPPDDAETARLDELEIRAISAADAAREPDVEFIVRSDTKELSPATSLSSSSSPSSSSSSSSSSSVIAPKPHRARTLTWSSNSAPASAASSSSASRPPTLVFDDEIGDSIKALPKSYRDAWDDGHVRLPCSPANMYTRRSHVGSSAPSDGQETPVQELARWELIQRTLHEPMRTVDDLVESIVVMNGRRARHWDCAGLHYFFDILATADERSRFFSRTLPFIVDVALRLPELVTNPLPLLRANREAVVELSAAQCVSLLACAALCIMPRQGSLSSSVHVDHAFQNFNFIALYAANGAEGALSEDQAAKLRCLWHYFERARMQMPTGTVRFARRVEAVAPDWATSSEPIIRALDVRARGLIEDDTTSLQADFANCRIGGGVLGAGCIQEEIRFIISPALLVSLLITEQLGDAEVVFISGSERVCAYSGYSRSFRFVGDYVDTTARVGGSIATTVVAVDALYFGHSKSLEHQLSQYAPENLRRELLKFYGACRHDPRVSLLPAAAPMASGNWGCGGFGGHFDLKAVIQLLAASQARRPLTYYTFEEPGLCESLRELHATLVAANATVGRLFTSLMRIAETEWNHVPQLFNIILDEFEA